MSGLAPWMIWAIFAIVMIIAEAVTSGFFLLFIGIGALPAAGAAALGLQVPVQLAVFVVSSIILLVFCRRIVVRLSMGTSESDNVGANRMMGRKGMVIETIDRAKAKGKVRVDRDVWNAEPDSGEMISEGAWVEVVRVDGTRLIVKESTPD